MWSVGEWMIGSKESFVGRNVTVIGGYHLYFIGEELEQFSGMFKVSQ